MAPSADPPQYSENALAVPAPPTLSSKKAPLLPVTNQIKNIFDCYYPEADQAIKIAQQSATLPTNLTEALNYAISYIDQGIHVSRALEQKYEILEKRYYAATEIISNDLAELKKLQEQIASHRSRVVELEDSLAAQKRLSARLQLKLNNAGEAGDSAEIVEIATSSTNEYLEKYNEAQQEIEVIKIQLTAEKNSNTILHKDRTTLEASIAAQEHELQDLQRKFAKLSQDFAEGKHQIDVDGHIIAGLRDERETLNRIIREKTLEIEVIRRESEATIRAMRAELDETHAELNETRERLEKVEEEKRLFEGKHHDCEAVKAELDQTREELEKVEEDKQQFEANHHDCEAVKAELTQTRENLEKVEEEKRQFEANHHDCEAVKAELDLTREDLEKVEEGKQQFEANHHDCEAVKAELTQTRENLEKVEEDKRQFETNHHDCEAVKAELTQTREYLEKVEEEKRQFETNHQDCEAKLKTAEDSNRLLEEKLAKLQAELEEAKKPVLPNKVTLRNPIAITGSLRGANGTVDDQFFPLDLPFPVTFYGHSSSKIFVGDNGMLCLDEGTDARDLREGSRLPCRPRRDPKIPPYSLFPFWTDLLLCKGKPHGIFYEIVGEPGARSLIIEWYVTRYGQEEQYFHFNLHLEESRPNIVTYNYYDAVDKGARCTIGVQGPDSYMMFSYNEPKVHPGLRVVFDTAASSIVESSFPVE